jgi:hypothetical protein
VDSHLKITGSLLIILGLIHSIFPRYFNWKEELKNVSLINKEIMYVHTFFIGLIVFLMGLLCLLASDDLLNTSLGHKILKGFSIFWGFRLIMQFFGYSSIIWKGKKFETTIHIIFALFWFYLTTLFGYCALN